MYCSLGSCTVNDTCTIYCLICYPITNFCSLPHISTRNGDCKIYIRLAWLAKANHCGSILSHILSLGYNTIFFLQCGLILQPIRGARILFIPMTPVQQTIKKRMCNREITAVGFNSLLQCWLCEFWLWLLQHCKWCLNMCCHFLGGISCSLGCNQNRVSWKQNSDTDELRTVVDNSFRYCFFIFHFWIITIATVVYL